MPEVEEIIEEIEEQPVDEVKKETEVEEIEEKLFTQSDVSKIVSQRLARVKADAIKIKVEEATAALNAEKASLLAELSLYKQEAEKNAYNKEVQEVAERTGLSFDILKKTGLKGQELAAFAESLEDERKSWKITPDKVLKESVLKSSGKKSETWEDVLMAQIKGGK